MGQTVVYSGCPFIPALLLSKKCRDKGGFAVIRVQSTPLDPYPGIPVNPAKCVSLYKMSALNHLQTDIYLIL